MRRVSVISGKFGTGQLRREHRLALFEDETRQRVERRAGGTERGDVADRVDQQLAVLPRHDVGPRDGLEPGAAQVGRVGWHFCTGAPQGATRHVGNADGEVTSGSCADGLPFDPGGGSDVSFPAAEGRSLTSRLWVTDGEHGPPLGSDSVRLGLGVYAVAPGARVAGFTVPDLVEYDGRSWRLLRTAAPEPGDREVEVVGTQTARPPLVVGFGSADEATIAMQDRTSGGLRSQGVEVGGVPIGVLSAGDRAWVRVMSEDVPADARLMIALYEPES